MSSFLLILSVAYTYMTQQQQQQQQQNMKCLPVVRVGRLAGPCRSTPQQLNSILYR
jgi:hypothetical protein